MSTQSIQIARSPSFFESVRESASKGVTWLSDNSKSVAASVGETATNVWASVSAFFTGAAQKLGEWFNMGKDAIVDLYGKGSEHVKSLSPEMKAGVGIGVAAGAVLTALFCKCCAKQEAAAATSETVSEGTAPAAQPATTETPK